MGIPMEFPVEIQSMIAEIKNSHKALNRRFELAEKRINKLEDILIEIMQSEEQRKK